MTTATFDVDLGKAFDDLEFGARTAVVKRAASYIYAAAKRRYPLKGKMGGRELFISTTIDRITLVGVVPYLSQIQGVSVPASRTKTRKHAVAFYEAGKTFFRMVDSRPTTKQYAVRDVSYGNHGTATNEVLAAKNSRQRGSVSFYTVTNNGYVADAYAQQSVVEFLEENDALVAEALESALRDTLAENMS